MSVKPISVATVTSQGAIKASAGDLLWLNVANPSAFVRQLTVCNATSGTSSIVFRVVVPAYNTHPLLNFGTGFHFTTGIWCGVVEAGLTVTAGYI